MLKYIITFIFILFACILNLNAQNKCYCFHYGDDFTKTTCKYYEKVVELVTDYKCEDHIIINKDYFFNWYHFDKSDIVMFVGFGSPKGFFESNEEDFQHLDNISHIEWQRLANLEVGILLIDACYAGYIFDYNPKSPTITSTWKENSWNIIDTYGKNVSSLSAALRCLYDDEYQCPVLCKTFLHTLDVNNCQLKLILYAIDNYWHVGINMLPWEYPSMGTCIFNNKPCFWK